MDYYFDIKIMPDEEVPIYFIRNKIFSKLHKVLCILKSTEIGVSFPHFKVRLGDVIRIHGSETRLTELQSTNWLDGLASYCTISSVQAIPEDVTHRIISRKQANMSEAKLRRLIKRGSISQDDIKEYKVKMFERGIDTPYLELESTSNGHKYRRYLLFGNLHNKPVTGSFDQFGLSKTATVPWF